MVDFKLYFVADIKQDMKHSPLDLIAQVLAGGADIVQLRYKSGSTRELIEMGQQIKPILQAQNIPFIINDRIDVALALDADGVHLGQDDMPIEIARKILGPDKIIGKSTHNLEQALAAQDEDLDYFAIGPIFPTKTKELADPAVGIKTLKNISNELRVNCPPWLAIGGINSKNIEQVLQAGARRIAVVSAIADAPDVEKATRELKSCL